MRSSSRRSSGTSALRAAMACWMAAAQATASTTLANSTSVPSPISLTMRPLWAAIVGSINSARHACKLASVPVSSAPMSRL